MSTLRADWQELFSASDATPFSSWEWISNWHTWFGKRQTPRLVCAREDGRLVGLLPLGEEERRVSKLPIRVRRLGLLGEGSGAADYLDVIARRGYERQCATVLLEYLAKRKDFDLLEIDGISASSPTLPLLTYQFSEKVGFQHHLSTRYVCPQLRIGDAGEGIIGESRRASYFNYCLRRLRKMPGFELRVVTAVEEMPDAFERFLTLHEARWAQRGEASAIGSPLFKSFHREVVMGFARAGRMRFEELWVEGQCRASLYGVESSDRYYFYLGGYDPAWSKYSLGFTLVGLSIGQAAKRGIRFYDFLRGAESYKFDWADDARATVALRVVNDTKAARLQIAADRTVEAARFAMQALLPDRALTAWRRWKRGGGRDSETAPVLAEAGNGGVKAAPQPEAKTEVVPEAAAKKSQTAVANLMTSLIAVQVLHCNYKIVTLAELVGLIS
jgi:CelD/BcsL family acetyltransferase involved in cellulose biosynthesis